jgi:glycosyltransferase involved in cell wall biosynthesis
LGAAPTICAAVLARDEAGFLEDCLASLAWADELLVVVDAASTDATEDIARRHTERVETHPWRGFGGQRNLALELATTDWVFFVDADERVLPSLAEEVRRAVRDGGDLAGYRVPRRNIIRGRWVRHAGWWPDRQLRLLRRSRARYDESAHVHEVAQLDGEAGTLTQPLIHFNYASLGEFREKQANYARLEARLLWERGVRARPHNLVLQPLREFRRRFLQLRGYRAGALGFALSMLMAEATCRTYAELLRIGRGDRRP